MSISAAERSHPAGRSIRGLAAGVALSGLLFAGACATGRGAAPSAAPDVAEKVVTTVYALRHAEKESGEDPGLTAKGRVRAEALAEMLGDDDVAAVFATEYRRTKETVRPLARALGVEIQIAEADAPEELARFILDEYRGAAVVVAGHSNTLPRLLSALGVRERITLEEDEYGDLFAVVVDGDFGEPVGLTRHRFGD